MRYTLAVFMGLFILFGAALVVVVVLLTAAMAWVMAHPPRRTMGVAVGRGQPTDPVEAGAASFMVDTVDASDGVPIELWIAEGEDPHGPSVVLIHGWADSRFGALLWLPAVLPTASRVVLYDLRGHGDAGHRTFEWGRSEADDALRVVERVAALHPDRPIVLMGLSMGSMIAIDAAAEDAAAGGRRRVSAVVADSPFVRPGEVVGRMCRSLGLPHWPMTPLALWALALRWPGMWTFDTAARASALRCPLLVMVGELDRVSPVDDARRVSDGAERSTLHVFDGAAHLAAACTDRARYTSTLRDFFALHGRGADLK